MNINPRVLALLTGVALFASACDKAYYGTMKKFGLEKRHILVDRVKEARDGQEEAKEQFKTTLERFKELTAFDGGELEDTYKKLLADFETCEARANEVKAHVDAIEVVAEDLFSEWKAEADEIQTKKLRWESERMLRESRDNYQDLMEAMRKAEGKMEPPLAAFKDQVLMLKHHLNAKMVASLKGDLGKIEDDVEALIAEMEASIKEADRFVDAMPLQ